MYVLTFTPEEVQFQRLTDFTKCSLAGLSELRKMRPFDIPVSQDLFQSSDNEHLFGVISHRRQAPMIPLLGWHGSARGLIEISHLHHHDLCTGSSSIVLHHLPWGKRYPRQLLRYCRRKTRIDHKLRMTTDGWSNDTWNESWVRSTFHTILHVIIRNDDKTLRNDSNLLFETAEKLHKETNWNDEGESGGALRLLSRESKDP